MIGYLDTSAFVPLLVDEPTSQACRLFWEDADTVVSSRLLYVETAAALALANRTGRLDDDAHRRCLDLLDELWPAVDAVEIDDDLIRTAAGYAKHHALRGYDAVHCAAAVLIDDDDVVAAAGDHELLRAWERVGLATFDTKQSA